MSLSSLSDYVTYAKYAHFIPSKMRRENWGEIVDRVFGMHERKYEKVLNENQEFREMFLFTKDLVRKKAVLGSQRALQYGGEPTLKRNERIYNCSGLLVDKPKVFQDVVWLLLAGCGVGINIQKHHIGKLPDIREPNKNEVKTFVVPDTCEGWADAFGVLMSSYFVGGGEFKEYEGVTVRFDFSKIRPKGSLIAGQFKAPGYEPLKKGIERIVKLINKRVEEGATRLEPIDCFDIICHSSDCVISGGLRRSALITLFSKDDEKMAQAKIGNWYIENPQRGRSNNSVVLQRNKTSKEEFDAIFENIKSFGEPGFYFVEDEDGYASCNPCCEIGFWNRLENGKTAVAFCNLTEINGKKAVTKEKFIDACKAASFLGTLQAGYTDFPYLGKDTEDLVKRESLLGISITGWMDNPDILFDENILKEGVQACKDVNEKVAKIIGINPSARLNCVKPSGSASSLLGVASGIHPHHARRYIRNVQANQQEFPVQKYKEINPLEVEKSVWSANGTDDVISFMCEVPSGAILKNSLTAIEFLEKIKKVQRFWVMEGTVKERCLNQGVVHNVSNTVNVKDGEWDGVRDFIFHNRDYFSGISLLSGSGDLDYRQAAFITILNEKELVEKYGAGSMLASGLIVDGLDVFDDDIFTACEYVTGIRSLPEMGEEPIQPVKPVFSRLTKDYNKKFSIFLKDFEDYIEKKESFDKLFLQHDWVRRANQFAFRYFENDVRKMCYCLKHVKLWKKWLDMKRDHREIDWSSVVEERQVFQDADTQAAVACSGGACEII